MQTPELFTLLPEEYVATPDGMSIDREGNLYGYVTGSITREIMDSIIEQTLAGK